MHQIQITIIVVVSISTTLAAHIHHHHHRHHNFFGKCMQEGKKSGCTDIQDCNARCKCWEQVPVCAEASAKDGTGDIHADCMHLCENFNDDAIIADEATHINLFQKCVREALSAGCVIEDCEAGCKCAEEIPSCVQASTKMGTGEYTTDCLNTCKAAPSLPGAANDFVADDGTSHHHRRHHHH